MAPEPEGKRPARRRWRPLRGVRARLFAYSIVLLFVGIAVTVLTVRQILLVRLDSRVENTLVQEVQEFRRLADGTDPETGRPFRGLRPLFDLYLGRNVLTAGEQLLTFRGGRLYREKDTEPAQYRLGSQPDLVRRWRDLDEPQSGSLDTPAGPVRYLAVPVSSRAGEAGTFVVAAFIAGEREEIDDAVTAAAGVGVAILLIGSVIAFLAAGRVLRPLRELTDTARSIEETDLTRRIEVRGDDELAELGRTFNAMLDRLETSFSSQRELIRDVSHELRTPITIVRGHLELLGDDPAERDEAIELVTDELDRMSRLVEDLLILARSERPDFLQREPIQVGEFTSEVLAKARQLGDRRWALELGRDGIVVADPQRLTQALVNLADNAVKQTQPGARIELGSSVDGRWARFWVADDGPGLAAADRSEVFRRFARGSAGRQYAGTGLGLAIVEAVAHAHGGRAGVESEPGEGARFTIEVPASENPRTQPRSQPGVERWTES
jgi:two-component system, OmpR family, sensor kinase